MMSHCAKLMGIGLVIALAACSGDSNGPRAYPPIGGRYQATFHFDFANSIDQQGLDVAGSISLSDPDANGDFDGTIDEWGDEGAPPTLESAFLSAEWPHCDFTSVTTDGMGGELSGSGLSLQGQLGFQCAYTNGSDIANVPTTLTETVTGT
jgi:hypothetical protein